MGFKVTRRHLTRRQRSKLSEKELAKQYGGRVQPASGALPVAGLKGDVITEHFLFDDKTTLAESFSVNRKAMRKLAREGFQARRLPVMRVAFEESGDNYFVMSESTFNQLANAYLNDV